MIELFGAEEEPSVSQLEEALRNAIRADRLVNNPDFRWWREGYLELERQRAGTKLDAAVDHPNQANVYRGIRKGIEKVLKGLDVLAARKTFLEERLNERRTEHPVT